MELKKFILIVAMAFGVSAGTVGEGTVNVQSLTTQYTVKSGDTLTGIAHALFGRASAWKDLEITNKTIVKDPHFIKPGMVLTYSVEAAQQSMAQVLRAKELRKLAGKQISTRIAKTSMKTHKQVVKYKQVFGPTHTKVARVQKAKPAVVTPQRVPANTKTQLGQKLTGMTGFKSLEI